MRNYMKSFETEDYVVCIGSCCIDILGTPINKLKIRDSNPGRVCIASGGVCRNIAENLARLNVNTKLFSSVGKDVYGDFVLNHTKKTGVNIDNVVRTTDYLTAADLSILDNNRDMYVSVSDLETTNSLDLEFVKSRSHIIENAKIILLDANPSEEVIEFVLNTFSHKKIVVDPVSISKCIRFKTGLENVHTIKPNQYEAACISGIDENSRNFYDRVLDWFLEKGINQVFISLAENGVLYGDENTRNIQLPIKREIINCNGAGDAFCAGLIYGNLMEFDIHDTAVFSSAMSGVAIGGKSTVSENMCLEKVMELLELNEYRLKFEDMDLERVYS